MTSVDSQHYENPGDLQAQFELNKELLKASKECDLNKVVQLVNQGADVNNKGNEYPPSTVPLYEAVTNVCTDALVYETVKFLLENGADPNIYFDILPKDPLYIWLKPMSLIQYMCIEMNEYGGFHERISKVIGLLLDYNTKITKQDLRAVCIKNCGGEILGKMLENGGNQFLDKRMLDDLASSILQCEGERQVTAIKILQSYGFSFDNIRDRLSGVFTHSKNLWMMQYLIDNGFTPGGLLGLTK